jgi:hypothetical protein
MLANGQLNMTGTMTLVVVSVTGSQSDFRKLSWLAPSNMPVWPFVNCDGLGSLGSLSRPRVPNNDGNLILEIE